MERHVKDMRRGVRVLVIAWPCTHYGGAERWWFLCLKSLMNLGSSAIFVETLCT